LPPPNYTGNSASDPDFSISGVQELFAAHPFSPDQFHSSRRINVPDIEQLRLISYYFFENFLKKCFNS
jgi:hypothetical protein